MIQLSSTLTGRRMYRDKAGDFLGKHGFTVGGGWDYDKAYFDYVFRKKPVYDVLRIPVSVKQGDFEQPSAVLEYGIPFVLRHVYERGNDTDQSSMPGLMSGFTNQFQEPIEKDAEVSMEFIEKSEILLRRLEEELGSEE